jgi:predicted transcriptional regulator
MTDRLHELGSAELEVLKALWEIGPATVREVLNHLHDRGRKVAYTTVLTFLTRLEQKGFAASNKSDLAYVYRARVSGASQPLAAAIARRAALRRGGRAARAPINEERTPHA